ncbi:MAG: hypothetical protein P8168_12465 [Deltaproteobacteria bacterium]
MSQQVFPVQHLDGDFIWLEGDLFTHSTLGVENFSLEAEIQSVHPQRGMAKSGAYLISYKKIAEALLTSSILSQGALTKKVKLKKMLQRIWAP